MCFRYNLEYLCLYYLFDLFFIILFGVYMFEFVLVLQGECDKYYGLEFVFEIYVKELIVGDIYVRIYNEQFIFFLEVSICICNDKEIEFDLLCI